VLTPAAAFALMLIGTRGRRAMNRQTETIKSPSILSLAPDTLETEALSSDSLIGELHHKHPSVRANAAAQLGRILPRPAVAPLLEVIRKDEPLVRYEAARALVAINDPLAIPALIRAITDKNALVRERAAVALKALKDPQAVRPLISLLANPNAEVRRNAAWI